MCSVAKWASFLCPLLFPCCFLLPAVDSCSCLRINIGSIFPFIQILTKFQFFLPVTPCVVFPWTYLRGQHLAAVPQEGTKTEFSGNNKAASAVWCYFGESIWDNQLGLDNSTINSTWLPQASRQQCCKPGGDERTADSSREWFYGFGCSSDCTSPRAN